MSPSERSMLHPYVCGLLVWLLLLSGTHSLIRAVDVCCNGRVYSQTITCVVKVFSTLYAVTDPSSHPGEDVLGSTGRVNSVMTVIFLYLCLMFISLFYITHLIHVVSLTYARVIKPRAQPTLLPVLLSITTKDERL